MLLKQIMNRKCNKNLTDYIVPITKALAYYEELEIQNVKQINPFRKLTNGTGTEVETDMEESPLRFNDLQNKPFQVRPRSNMNPLFFMNRLIHV